MNLMMHGIDEPNIDYKDIDERYKAKCCDSDAKDWLEQVRILRDAQGSLLKPRLPPFDNRPRKRRLPATIF